MPVAVDLAALVVNGRFMTRPPTGVDRFATELLRARFGASASRPVAAVPPGAAVREGMPLATQAVGHRGGHGWEQFDLPRALAGRALINLCNTAPAWLEPQLVVIHDAATAATPSNYTPAFRAWYRVLLTLLMRRARVVATVSRFSADELQRHFGRRRAGIEVIGEGGEHILREAADESVIDRLGLRGRRFVLAVGSASANKNFGAALKAVQALAQKDVLLVATGAAAAGVFGRQADLSGERLVAAGYVSDAELRALYEHALCFAFPSRYEGFGLPPLEAMCCGCPAVVSQRASMPEVCGSAALYCDPDDPRTLADALSRLLESPALRAELAEAGRARAAQHGWGRAATQFGDIVAAHFPGQARGNPA